MSAKKIQSKIIKLINDERNELDINKKTEYQIELNRLRNVNAAYKLVDFLAETKSSNFKPVINKNLFEKMAQEILQRIDLPLDSALEKKYTSFKQKVISEFNTLKDINKNNEVCDCLFKQLVSILEEQLKKGSIQFHFLTDLYITLNFIHNNGLFWNKNKELTGNIEIIKTESEIDRNEINVLKIKNSYLELSVDVTEKSEYQNFYSHFRSGKIFYYDYYSNDFFEEDDATNKNKISGYENYASGGGDYDRSDDREKVMVINYKIESLLSDIEKIIIKTKINKIRPRKKINSNPIKSKEIEFCGKTNVPIGALVKVVKNLGNQCEPFLNLTGVATHPFRKGCTKKGWIGVVFPEETIYGNKFNFHIDELEIYE